jgi:hypothetical protein
VDELLAFFLVQRLPQIVDVSAPADAAGAHPRASRIREPHPDDPAVMRIRDPFRQTAPDEAIGRLREGIVLHAHPETQLAHGLSLPVGLLGNIEQGVREPQLRQRELKQRHAQVFRIHEPVDRTWHDALQPAKRVLVRRETRRPISVR